MYFILTLIIILVIFYLYNKNYDTENFNQYAQLNRYQSLKPYTTEPNIDYQNYLNENSGYDGATRSYYNPYFAKTVADGLDTL